MQELKPEMDRINEKYKGKPDEKTRAMQELWRKHNYNPMSGCMLAFFQLPIFIGLYRALMINVELRQAPLLSEGIQWCSNLAAPDMLCPLEKLALHAQFSHGLSRLRLVGAISEYSAAVHRGPVHLAAADVYAAGHRRSNQKCSRR